MSHQDNYYRNNQAYAEFLAGWDAGFYAKYTDTLRPQTPQGRVLDVGCGAGQVVHQLEQAGYDAYGVDVSKPNIEKASVGCRHCMQYDGKKLPFDDDFFECAGALNVLEHVDEPEKFISELVRVVRKNGRIVLSSPNFMRTLGFRDYHPKMRGIANKYRNWKRLGEKKRMIAETPEAVRFDKMQPIVKEPFTPDDDAIVATNGLEMEFFLKKNGCEIVSEACTDRYVATPLDFLLNLGPWKYLMFNAFVVARKIR